MKIDWKTYSFNDFTIDSLYETLRLRSEVFVVEQDCVYQDIDNKDQKALHVLGYNNNELVAYTRIFDKGFYFDEASIGRVIVKQVARGKNIGHELITESIKAIEVNFKTKDIKISAQEYLKKFYEEHQFVYTGKSYLEDGIPHIEMEMK